MKKLLTLVVILVVLVGAALGGGYLYASSNIEEIALKANVEELAFLENTATVEATKTTSGTTSIYMPLFLGAQPFEDNADTTATTSIDVTNKVVTIVEDGETQELTLEEYLEKENPVKDFDKWEEVINNGDYKLEEENVDGVDMYKYTIQSDTLTEDYLPGIQQEILESTNDLDLGVEGISTTNVDISYDGEIVFVVYIGKDDYVIKKAQVMFTDDMVISMEFEGAGVDQILQAFQLIASTPADQVDPSLINEETQLLIDILTSLNGEIPEPTAEITFSDLELEYVYETFELKDGKELPTNPLMLWIATMIS